MTSLIALIGLFYASILLGLGVFVLVSLRGAGGQGKDDQRTTTMTGKIESLQLNLAVAKLQLDATIQELSATKETARKEVAEVWSATDQLRVDNAKLRTDLEAANRKLVFAQYRLDEVQERIGANEFREHANGEGSDPIRILRRGRRNPRNVPWALRGMRFRDLVAK